MAEMESCGSIQRMIMIRAWISGGIEIPMRWQGEAEAAAERRNMDVIDVDGISDYHQGWGVLLLRTKGYCAEPLHEDCAEHPALARACHRCNEIVQTNEGLKWAMLSWAYGSCSGCDRYEGMEDTELHQEFDALIEDCEGCQFES
jgi:hypothetical protein